MLLQGIRPRQCNILQGPYHRSPEEPQPSTLLRDSMLMMALQELDRKFKQNGEATLLEDKDIAKEISEWNTLWS